MQAAPAMGGYCLVWVGLGVEQELLNQHKGHMVVTMTAAMTRHCVIVTVIATPWGAGKGQGGGGLGWGVCQGP